MTDPKRLDDAVAAFHAALDADPDSEVFHCPPPCTCGTTEGRTREIVGALLAAGWRPPVGPWRHIRTDEHVALCRVEMQARDAVDVARMTGLRLGPLQAALDELTGARGELPHWHSAAQSDDDEATER